MNTDADAIRAALKELGASTRTKDLVAYLNLKQVRVTPQQVSNEKARLAKQNREAIEDLPASILKRVKQLVDELGSTLVIRKALDELDELMTTKTKS